LLFITKGDRVFQKNQRMIAFLPQKSAYIEALLDSRHIFDKFCRLASALQFEDF
jgi:hypothetical protein